MSHFVGLCFGDNWENNLEQYYKGLEVEPYIHRTKEEAIEKAKKYHTENYEYAVKKLKSDTLTPEDRDYYTDVVNRGDSLTDEEAWEEVLNWNYEIDAEGNLLTTYNPDSKWDWYSIGGRWSEFLPLKELDSEGNYLTTHEALVEEIDWEYLLEYKYPPFCFVTEDGEWIEKGEMGWFGISFDEIPEDSWKTQFSNYVKELDPDCLVTVIDFHI